MHSGRPGSRRAACIQKGNVYQWRPRLHWRPAAEADPRRRAPARRKSASQSRDDAQQCHIVPVAIEQALNGHHAFLPARAACRYQVPGRDIGQRHPQENVAPLVGRNVDAHSQSHLPRGGSADDLKARAIECRGELSATHCHGRHRSSPGLPCAVVQHRGDFVEGN